MHIHIHIIIYIYTYIHECILYIYILHICIYLPPATPPATPAATPAETATPTATLTATAAARAAATVRTDELRTFSFAHVSRAHTAGAPSTLSEAGRDAESVESSIRVQLNPSSRVQFPLHPSASWRLPSSHSSSPA